VIVRLCAYFPIFLNVIFTVSPFLTVRTAGEKANSDPLTVNDWVVVVDEGEVVGRVVIVTIVVGLT